MGVFCANTVSIILCMIPIKRKIKKERDDKIVVTQRDSSTRQKRKDIEGRESLGEVSNDWRTGNIE